LLSFAAASGKRVSSEIRAPIFAPENLEVENRGVSVDYSGLNSLRDQEQNLRAQHRKQRRDAHNELSEDMRDELIALLQLFGIPYILSPMEAEAQCAKLEQLGLVDGIVSDDSDTWLFGASTVYKNIFDEKKYVEVYLASDIEKDIGLDREDMICMALLLGSDYTPGISGIGIVNAAEIVATFPGFQGLCEFRDWLQATSGTSDSGIFDPQKSLSKQKQEEMKPVMRFKYKHRGARLRWKIGEGWPSEVVRNAYLHPEVDESTEAFTWSVPNVEGLVQFCIDKLQWTDEKSRQTILPAMKEMAKSDVQTRIEGYFRVSYDDQQRAALIKSKRLLSATNMLKGKRKHITGI